MEDRDRGALGLNGPALAEELETRAGARSARLWDALEHVVANPGDEDAREATLELAEEAGVAAAEVRERLALLQRRQDLRDQLSAQPSPAALAEQTRAAGLAMLDHDRGYAEWRKRWLREHEQIEAQQSRAAAACETRRQIERDLAQAERALALRRDPGGVAHADSVARERRERETRLADLRRQRAAVARDLDALTRGVFMPAGNPNLVPVERARLEQALAVLDAELEQLGEPAEATR